MTCRICFDSSPSLLLQPCNCKGTSAYVHYQCLTTWLRVSGRRKCNVCNSDFRGAYSYLFRFASFCTDVNETFESKLQEFLTGVYLIFIILVCLMYAWYLQWTLDPRINVSNTKIEKKKE
ncbi:uncharacterized protein B4U79_01273 [Dinothrombium tinctorium]|uniref:RING-CH-type domain-containing protein n=2 Tax=Dinothrombium tinctorium TaxID=1965070 RepID=A0A443QGT0_9ACAR|nr:uncharacterized protein B4U79_01273 [Dinothrombium tinctorium]